MNGSKIAQRDGNPIKSYFGPQKSGSCGESWTPHLEGFRQLKNQKNKKDNQQFSLNKPTYLWHKVIIIEKLLAHTMEIILIFVSEFRQNIRQENY